MPPPVTDAETMRANMDVDYDQSPILNRLGKDAAVRRERLATRARVPNTTPAGSFSRSATGMASLRSKLNGLRTAERRSGAQSTTFSSVLESARTDSEPFKPQSTISVAITPSNRATFETRVAPEVAAAGQPWFGKPDRVYDKKQPRTMMSVEAGIRPDAAAADVADFEENLKAVNKLMDMMFEDDKDMSMRLVFNRDKKSVSLKMFVRDEDADPLKELVDEVGENLFGDTNPLRNNLDIALKNYQMKIETGSDLTELPISRDSVLEPLENLRVTVQAEVSSDLATHLYPGTLQHILTLASGGYRRRAAERFQASLATTLPLFAVKNVEQHVTLDDPSHLFFNVLRQLSFFQRITNDLVPGTTASEDFVIAFVTRYFPVFGATGLGLFNFLHFLWMVVISEEEALQPASTLAHSAAKILGPVQTLRFDGHVLSALISVDGISPAKYEFSNVEEQLAYIKAMWDARTQKPDQFTHVINVLQNRDDDDDSGSGDGASDGDDDGSDFEMDAEEAPSDEEEDMGPEEKAMMRASIDFKKRFVAAAKKAGIKKGMLNEERFGTLGWERGTGDPKKPGLRKRYPEEGKMANVGTISSNTQRRNCAVTVLVLGTEDSRAQLAKLIRAWSTENRLDNDVFEDVESMIEDTSILGRCTNADGKVVNFVVPSSLRNKDLLSRCADAVVLVGPMAEEEVPSMTATNKKKLPSFARTTIAPFFNIEFKEQSSGRDASSGFNASFTVSTEDSMNENQELLGIRDQIVAEASSSHGPSFTASNGLDHAYTQLPLLAKAVVKSSKAKKAAEEAVISAAGLALGSSDGGWSSDDSD